MLRLRLTDKVFVAMTTSVPEAKAQGAYAPAVAAIEPFLALFPAPASADHAGLELCAGWIGPLSYRSDWSEIERVSRTAEPYARQADAHPDFGSDVPARRPALQTFADEMIQRGYDRSFRFPEGSRVSRSGRG